MIELSRRRVLTGLIAAPAVIRTAGLLMPIRAIVTAPPLLRIVPLFNSKLLTEVGRMYGIPRILGEQDFAFRARLLSRIVAPDVL